jgi:hypothetical protein
MRILLLHPEDDIHASWARAQWDLVVDLGRAPQSLYDEWSAQLRCPVLSIFDSAREIEDLWLWGRVLQLGLGRVVDRFGIDWWDVIGLVLQPELQEVRLAIQLAEKLGTCQKITVSRPSMIAEALRLQLGCPLEVLHSGKGKRVGRTIGRYQRALRSLSVEHLRQVVYDKYDPHYAWRRRLAGRAERSSQRVVLLPSAYSNVTKAALSYAKILPDQQFLLVLARESGAVSPVPNNVQTEVLAAFATEPCDKNELRLLESSWVEMEQSLRDNPDFSLSIQLGILKKARRWLRWGVAVRDAWNQVFEMRSIVGCLSADDSNPYTRVPLLLALHRGIPAVACHHGALDGRMAFKNHRFSKYLAKGEMEQDYLERICRVNPHKIEIGAASAPSEHRSLWTEDAPWIVFFSESYEADSWRVEAMYRELLPRLLASARRSGKRIVVKLHPFESLRQRRRILNRILNSADQHLVSLTDEPFSRQILEKTWCAVAVESTAAFECATVGIPVFLCGWLRHAYVGYSPQYARFGVGRMMEVPDDLLKIPDTLRTAIPADNVAERLVQPITAKTLSEVLCGSPANRLR